MVSDLASRREPARKINAPAAIKTPLRTQEGSPWRLTIPARAVTHVHIETWVANRIPMQITRAPNTSSAIHRFKEMPGTRKIRIARTDAAFRQEVEKASHVPGLKRAVYAQLRPVARRPVSNATLFDYDVWLSYEQWRRFMAGGVGEGTTGSALPRIVVTAQFHVKLHRVAGNCSD